MFAAGAGLGTLIPVGGGVAVGGLASLHGSKNTGDWLDGSMAAGGLASAGIAMLPNSGATRSDAWMAAGCIVSGLAFTAIGLARLPWD